MIMATADQISMPLGAAPQDTTPRPTTLGLVVDQETLLSALQTGWLPPPPGQRGHLLEGLGRFTPDPVPSRTAYRIAIALSVPLTALPPAEVLIYQDGRWRRSTLTAESAPEAVWWPGDLPLFDARLRVDCDEARARLGMMARQASNVSLPEVEVDASIEISTLRTQPLDHPLPAGVVFPSNYDTARGALAMAWWAVPRVDPWYELLVASMNADTDVLHHQAQSLEAPWLAYLPWGNSSAPPQSLWSSCWDLLPLWRQDGTFAFLDALSQRLDSTRRPWLTQTRAVLNAEASIDFSTPNAVELALQLVMTRPEPERFKTWPASQPALRPAVWWTAAILSGGLCGYERLPRAFRGDPPLQRALAFGLLDSAHRAPVTWQSTSHASVFKAGDDPIAEKPRKPRQAWFQAKLSDRLDDLAIAEARRLGWPCLLKGVQLPAGRYLLQGEARIEHGMLVVDDAARLAVGDGTLVDQLDRHAFRRCLVHSGGQVTQWPQPQQQQQPQQPQQQQRAVIRPVEPNVAEVPGLIYQPDFLTHDEHEHLLAKVDAAPWRDAKMKRRVQHYGWRYDYKARRVDESMRLDPLPNWLAALAKKLHTSGLLPWLADQVIVNEYIGKQGISRHVDQPKAFAEAIATISLGESWTMRFRLPGGKVKYDHLLERGSVAVMTGPARYAWQHEIPARQYEGKGKSRRLRGRRVSLTFRQVML